MSTYYADIELHDPSTFTDAAVEAISANLDPLAGYTTTPGGQELGVSLAVDADDHRAALTAVQGHLDALLAEHAPTAQVTSLRVLDAPTRDAENAAPRFPPMVSTPEVAELLGVARQTAWRIVKRKDFPAPAITTGSGPLWERAVIESWNQHTNRTPGRPKHMNLTYTDNEGQKYPCTIIDKRPTAGYMFIEYIKNGETTVENVDASCVGDLA